MTKVIRTGRCGLAWVLLACVAAITSWGQDQPNPSPESGIRVLGKTPPLHLDPAETLYLQLRDVGLDKSRVYHIGNLSIERAALHLTLDDGTIAFTEDVAGRVTGAFFEGDGEVLFVPPNRVERSSMALFTGAAILEERFLTAYFRFNDDTFNELQPALGPADHAQEFVTQWNETARSLAQGDALRMFMSLSQFLPVAGQMSTAHPARVGNDDRFLHVRVQGRKLGTFDLYYDSDSPEQVWVGQPKTVEGDSYYDVWSSFSLPQIGGGSDAMNSTTGEGGKVDAIAISDYRIRAEIKPPSQIDAEATVQLEVGQGGRRTVLFELSRVLQIKQVEAAGHPVEFIHNPAIEGSHLARQGNDLVAVVFPAPLQTGRHLDLRFTYGGEVLSEAASGLLYVGARGTWYPSRGLTMSNFDLEFHYPPGWTLLATGKRQDAAGSAVFGGQVPAMDSGAGEQVSRWVSERPIPVVGFNLGKYERVTAHAGDVTVETYATGVVERGFPKPPPQEVIAPPSGSQQQAPLIISPAPPSPARNAQKVADEAARAIEFFSHLFGPYPFSSLAITQLPGPISQGWPGLIFLSSYSFLTPEEKSQLHMSAVDKTLITQVIAHETAHQWWGDLVGWNGYRDQWIVEALANYSSMMLLESEDPSQFHAAMEKYRDDLLQKNKAGVALLEDGPVTLGTRLSCSQFPSGYEDISYGRGTWLLHMLRSMMRDSERKHDVHTSGGNQFEVADEPFVRALRRLRERYQGKSITTREFLQAFEDELPRSLWYEGHKSLDWFYQGWVNGTAIPHFELRGVRYSNKPGATAISGTIVQKDAPEVSGDLGPGVRVGCGKDGAAGASVRRWARDCFPFDRTCGDTKGRTGPQPDVAGTTPLSVALPLAELFPIIAAPFSQKGRGIRFWISHGAADDNCVAVTHWGS